MGYFTLRRLTRILTACLLLLSSAAMAAPPLDRLRLPEGFVIETLPVKLPTVRQLALAPDGTLYAGSFRSGNVYAVPDALTGGDRVIILASGLTMPTGLTLLGADLYVGALNRILKFEQPGARLRHNLAYVEVTDALPDKTHHGWKYLSTGPDGALYVPVGAPCNICKSDDPRFASILRMDPDTGATAIHAAGIRNSVGMAWHPDTGELWFTDNGRDMLGDDIPPEEVNRVRRPGLHFGYPHIHGGDLRDPEFGSGHDPADYEPPVARIQAHAAALGIDFYTGTAFPERYRGALFIAEHGSWNRSSKVGYQVSVLIPAADGWSYEPFVTGWLEGESNWGRPNDVLVTPGGDLLIADDQGGLVYRVRYRGPADER